MTNPIFMNAQEHLERLFQASIEAKQATLRQASEPIIAAAGIMADSLAAGGKLLLCGNGGSAADAQHLAAEMLVRLRPHINRRALPAIALAMDSSSLTASGNDYGYESHFERMTQALGRPGDVLIGITTSGKSPNARPRRESGLPRHRRRRSRCRSRSSRWYEVPRRADHA